MALMKFNTYIIELKHRENTFTGSLKDASGQLFSANFKKIGIDLFTASFKTQVEYKYMENVTLKGKNKDILVLLPLISKYNKRKLTRISKFLEDLEQREKFKLLIHLLSVEKFLKVEELLEFFTIGREEMLDFLVEMEIVRAVKTIQVSSFFITSYENFQYYLDELNAIFTSCYTNRVKTIKLSEIEAKLKLSQFSLFFKYLVRHLSGHFSFKVQKDKIIFQKLALSETEKGSIDQIEEILKKHKIAIFTIDNILHHSDLLYKEVNDSLWHLIEIGKVVQLNEKYYMFTEDLNKMLNKLKKYKRNQGEIIDIQAFRELTLLSRKYIITLFEYFDAQKITERLENKRKILLSV
jgi:hypothetical protein